jgi:curved DNA-binding protein
MPWVAALGGVAALTTPEGQIKLKIPAGSPSGRRLRLRGRGLARGRGERGDLYAEIRIVVPERLTSQQRTLLEQLAALDRQPDGAA